MARARRAWTWGRALVLGLSVGCASTTAPDGGAETTARDGGESPASGAAHEGVGEAASRTGSRAPDGDARAAAEIGSHQPATGGASGRLALQASLARLIPENGTDVVVDNVRLAGSPVAGSLAEHLGDLLEETLSDQPSVTLVADGEARDAALVLISRFTSELVDQDTVPELGQWRGARHLLRCEFRELSSPARVRLALDLVDLETLTYRTTSCEFPRHELPSGLSAQPSNAELIDQGFRKWLGQFPTGDDAPFSLELWTNRGVGGTYTGGDPLRLFVRSERAGQLTVQWLTARGKEGTIFPPPKAIRDRTNSVYAREGTIAAGGILEIPDATMGYAMPLPNLSGSMPIRAVVITDDGQAAQVFCGLRVREQR
jgi:hypothetical protein